MDLNSMFPKGKTFATEIIARRKLNEFEATLGPDADYHSVIVPVMQSVGLAGAKQRYQVIIILRHGNKVPPMWFIDAGFCVTN